MNRPTLTVTEFQAFTKSECDSKFFEALLTFSQSEGNECFLKHHKKSGIDYLKAQNYVGVIQTKYGTLEILPKCFDPDFQAPQAPNESHNNLKTEHRKKLKKFFEIENFKAQCFEGEELSINQDAISASKNFLIFCLKTLKKTPFKDSKTSSLDTLHTPLLDIFIQMFCYELLSLIAKGVWHDYVALEENRAYLKGKLLFNQHIRHNLTHKERFYTSSEEHIPNIAPNRLIKSTLTLIKSLATSHATHKLINRSLEAFEEIPKSANIKADFLSCKTSRHFSYYDDILAWCRLFLEGKSFTAFSGESKAYALLFPMERLFESYVAYMLTHSSTTTHTIQTQKSDKYLLNSQDKGLFQLRVDLHITHKESKEVIVADTKWKALKSTEDKKQGISQGDLYQLFAYAKYHHAKEVWLIYPKPYSQEEARLLKNIQEWNKANYQYTEGISLKVFFAPLLSL